MIELIDAFIDLIRLEPEFDCGALLFQMIERVMIPHHQTQLFLELFHKSFAITQVKAGGEVSRH
jgi:hypothetical protein